MVYPAPVYHVWFGIGRVSGLSGPSLLFPICKDHKQRLALSQPATCNLISGFLVSEEALRLQQHFQPPRLS
jgi:hypothetical protein